MLIILQNHRLSFSQICMSSSSFSYPPREPPFIQQSSSSSIFSRTIFYPTINLMFSDLSQFLLLHIIRAGIIYIYFQSIPHFQPYNTMLKHIFNSPISITLIDSLITVIYFSTSSAVYIVKANHLQPVQRASINKTSLNILHLTVLFIFTDFY